MRREHLVQGDITATVWPEAGRGVAILPGGWHPSYAEPESYSDWLDMQTDLGRFGLRMIADLLDVAIVADCEVIEIRPLVPE